MSLSDKLYLVMRVQEPLDKEEWTRRVARVLLCNDNKGKAGSQATREILTKKGITK